MADSFMKIVSFKDLIIWQKARQCTGLIYKYFSEVRDFGFRDQIRRASVSVMNNIAEGYARRNDKELKYFLRIANTSCVEVQSMIFLAYDLNYLNSMNKDELLEKTDELLKMINSFIKTLNK